MDPVLSGTTDTLERVECELSILLADEESCSVKDGHGSQVSIAPPRDASGNPPEIIQN
jgi:hypothetical protein